MKHFRTIPRRFKAAILIIAIAVSSFVTFSFVNNDFEVTKNLDIFYTLFQQLNLNYVDEINPGELIKTAIDAMLNSLDPYTNYIPESDLEDYTLMTTGQYGGIGALIQKHGDYVIVSEPYINFPAHKAGLKAGDRIVEINGNSTKGKTTNNISDILKGQPGTEIKLIIERDGEPKPIEKTIIREKIKIDNIPYYGMLNDNIAYIALNSFTQEAGKEVKNAFVELKSKHDVKGLVFDLRGNGGGLLDEAVNIVNIFVKKGQLIVSTKGKLKERNTYHQTLDNPIDLDIPLIVLVDNGSASASEIVSGAIQDLDRGVIIGEKTYGKGLVQNIVPLSYNTKLKVTIAKYYIPSGRCIQEIDYSHKSKNDSIKITTDSLVVAYKTKNGRLVYAKGGISPDIAIESEIASDISISLITKFLIFDFATKFERKNESIPPVREFEITDAIYNDFMEFISDKEYDYTTDSEKLLEKLKKTTEEEKYFEDIKTEYDALYNKMKHNKKEDLIKFKNEIKILLKNEIVSRYYYQKGRIEASFADDKDIIKALEILKDLDTYNSILAGTYKQENKKDK